MQLKKARRSLFRAWYHFEVLRIWLIVVGRVSIPDQMDKKSIAVEGAALAKGLEEVLTSYLEKYEALAKASEAMKVDEKGGDSGYVHRRARLKDALQDPCRVEANELKKRIAEARERVQLLGEPP